MSFNITSPALLAQTSDKVCLDLANHIVTFRVNSLNYELCNWLNSLDNERFGVNSTNTNADDSCLEVTSKQFVLQAKSITLHKHVQHPDYHEIGLKYKSAKIKHPGLAAS